MAQEVINVGSAPNDGTGDPLRTAYQKCNSNFGELFSRAQQSVPGSLVGSINDQAGMYAYDATYFYYCFQDYDGSSEIWAQVTNVGNVTIPRIINGTSSVDIAAPNSNVTISVDGVSNVAVFSNVGVTHNNLTILGNTVVGNVTPQADATYSLGTANVRWQSLYVESVVTQQIDYANSTVGIGDDSNVTISVDGVSNVAVFSPTHTDFSNVIITGNLAVTGDTTAGNIIPSTDVTYDLGSPSNKWRSLYLAGNTIYLGSAEITSTESSITLSSGSGAEFTISGDSAANTVGSFGGVEATGNIVGNVILANSMVTTTDISASGNIIADGFFIGTVLGNITGNFVIPGATTEVVYNSSGVADASSDFTYNNASKLLTVNGNIAANTVSVAAVTASGNVSAANLIGTLSTAAQPSITSVGTLTGLAVTGNISVTENISATNISGTLTTGSQTNITSVGILSSLSVSGNLAAADGSFTTIAGNGRSLTGLDASSLSTGIVASERLSGNYSIAVSTAATVTTAAQPNITSVGTLTSLSVTGNVTTGNISGTTGAFTTVTGNGRALTSINASNLDTGTVPQDRLSGLYNISVISANTSFSAATVSASAQPSITSLGVLTSLSVSGNTTSGNLTTGILTVDTVTAATQISTPVIAKTGSNGTGNIGSSVNYFNTVFAKATSAQYADLAEQYLSDANYNPGTVVKFGGTQEVTLADQDNDPLIAGVVSSNPAYLMNSGLIGQYVIAVALAGRVPCQVQGPIRKGQMIVSAGNGYGRAAVKPEIGTVIGKALENFDGETGIIEVVVGRL
jgi:hypothetical protein